MPFTPDQPTSTTVVTLVNGPERGETIEVAYKNPVETQSMSKGEIITLSINGAVGAGLVIGGAVAAAMGAGSAGGKVIMLGAKPLGKAIAQGMKALVRRVREANSTTVVIINGVPDSRLRITDFKLEDGRGELVDGYKRSEIEGAVARGSAESFEAVIFATHASGLVRGTDGRVRAVLTRRGVEDADLRIDFRNPVGKRQERSDYSHRVRTESGATLYEMDFELEEADGKSRRDVAVFMVMPA